MRGRHFKMGIAAAAVLSLMIGGASAAYATEDLPATEEAVVEAPVPEVVAETPSEEPVAPEAPVVEEEIVVESEPEPVVAPEPEPTVESEPQPEPIQPPSDAQQRTAPPEESEEEPAWVPQTTVTITPSECSADGAVVVLNLVPNIANGEGIAEIKIDGVTIPTQQGAVLTAGPGNHTYEYWVYLESDLEDGKFDDLRTLTGAFTVETCDEEPWVPQTTVTITPNGCSADGATVALNVIRSVGDGEEITDIQVDGVSINPTQAVAGPGVHSYTFWVRNIASGEVKTVTGTFLVKYCVPPTEPVEIPYPTIVGTVICGPANDTVAVDPEWLATWGSYVDGPWISEYSESKGNGDGTFGLDGSANIKAEFRGAYVWEGTADLPNQDWRQWRMYPGTAPFTYVDQGTQCPTDPTDPTDPVTPTDPVDPADPPAPSGGDQVSGDSGDSLAMTGSGDISGLAAWAALLLIAGVGLVMRRRKVVQH